MLKSLRSRNIALLVTVVVTGQLLALILTYGLAIRPQAQRLGEIMARNVAAVSMTMDALDPGERQALIRRLNEGRAIRIADGAMEPPEDRGIPTLLEVMFMRAFARAMEDQSVIIWQGGRNGQLWARVLLGGTPYWVSYERPPGWTPNGAVLASFVIALSLALVGGILLQRRIARPLRRLAGAVDGLSRASPGAPLPEEGPSEILAVSESFNRMQQRLKEEEANRAFMLAGISHDLRTPLAKIRLALALREAADPETEAMLARQLDRMDQMLAQFLDFARGIDAEPAARSDLAALVRSAVANADGANADGANADGDVTCLVEATLPIHAMVQAQALERAIVNLVRNSIAHGAPPIEVRLAREGAVALISVADRGPGAPEAILPRLAMPFVRADDARSSNGHSGLGLAIAARIAEAQGGSLRLANRDGGGFVATVTLPIDGKER